MSIYTRVLHIMMSILFMGILSSCGNDDSKAEKAKLSILPNKPIVITADMEEGDKKYTGPWFRFRGSMANGTTDTVTIVALEVEVTGLSSSGSPTTGKVAFTPGQFNQTLSVVVPPATEPTDIECEYTHFAELAAGSPDTKLGLYGSPYSQCAGFGPVFTIGSNPKGPEGNTNFRYTLKIKPLGWFGTFVLPTDRFQKTQTFYTQ